MGPSIQQAACGYGHCWPRQSVAPFTCVAGRFGATMTLITSGLCLGGYYCAVGAWLCRRAPEPARMVTVRMLLPCSLHANAAEPLRFCPTASAARTPCHRRQRIINDRAACKLCKAQACILGMCLAGYWCQDGSSCSTMNASAAGRLALCRA